MKYLKVLIIFLFLGFNCCAFAQNNYSYTAIEIYNSGVALQKQGNNELAEQKYNQALKLQPNFIEAKKNLSMIYHNQAIKAYSKDDYVSAIRFANKALQYSAHPLECYDLIATSQKELGDLKGAIATYNKMLRINPKDDNALYALAAIYNKTGQFDKSSALYQQILTFYPNDTMAQQNLVSVNHMATQKTLTNSINNLPIVAHAPFFAYRLIKLSPGVPNTYTADMKKILDLIWSEPNGEKMLKTMINKQVPINIVQYATTANTAIGTKKTTLALYGIIPVYSYNSTTYAVNIPFSYIQDFYNQNASTDKRIFALHTVLHEFGHAYMNIVSLGNKDSIEEELGVSMIGFNISYKILTGNYLTKEQTQDYSMHVLESLLNDDHRNLPVFGNFNRTMQSFGILMPYPQVYSDLPLMYKKLLTEKRISPVPSFFQYTGY